MQSVDAVILGILSDGPASGYDMKIEMDNGGAGICSALTFGSIYPRLKALQEEGYIVTYEASNQSRKRKVHDLTAKGWQALSEWAAEPPDYPIPMRDELLLRLCFWSGARTGDRETLIEHFRFRREQSLAWLARLKAWPTDGESYVSEFSLMAMCCGISRLEAELIWIDECIAQLEAAPTGPVQDPRGLEPLQAQRRENAARLASGLSDGSDDA